MSRFYDSVEKFYQNNNVYSSIIIHSNHNIDELIYLLKKNDYPLYNLEELYCLIPHCKIENIRMWIIPENLFSNWLLVHHFNLETISVIFCIGSHSYNTINNIMHTRLVNLHPHLKLIWI